MTNTGRKFYYLLQRVLNMSNHGYSIRPGSILYEDIKNCTMCWQLLDLFKGVEYNDASIMGAEIKETL